MTFLRYLCGMSTLPIKYLPQNLRDEQWGLTVCSVGHQFIVPGSEYPPREHVKEYLFEVSSGRVLDEYQLLYIVSGSGFLETGSAGRLEVKAGDMFLLFPGEWHTYSPYPETGWDEYWIGFSGANIDARVANGFFRVDVPLFHVGLDETAVQLYTEAISVASEQAPSFQQMLAGLVNHLLGILFVSGRRREAQTENLVNRAKFYMAESVGQPISMPEVARQLNTSYTTFRRQFRQYTGMSPAQYFTELRIHRAKQMLGLGSESVKEVSFALRFESPEYFSVVFKRLTGETPSEYRRRLCR